MSSTEVAIFAVVFVIAVIFFAWSCYKRFHLVVQGKKDNRFDHIGRRIGNMLFFAFGQRRVVSRPFGVNHFVLFWCFLILLIANAEFFLHGLFPRYINIMLLPATAYHVLACIFDIVSILALLAVIAAICRRLIFPPKYIDAKSKDAFIILGLVGLLMIAFFGMHGSEIALNAPLSGATAQVIVQAAPYMPVSNWVSTWMTGVSSGTLEILVTFFWWLHAIVLLVFLNYLPYSKHMHILTSIFNCFFKSLDKVTTQPLELLQKIK